MKSYEKMVIYTKKAADAAAAEIKQSLPDYCFSDKLRIITVDEGCHEHSQHEISRIMKEDFNINILMK